MVVDLQYHQLRTYTNDNAIIRELQRYILPAFNKGQEQVAASLSLNDAPLVATWKQYFAEAQTDGVYQTLRRYLVQFQFPVKAGISETEAYRQATRRGLRTAFMPEATGLNLADPAGLQLFLHPSVAGQIPVLVVEERSDFERIVQALCYRNEPRALPVSMGAAFIKGLNNWDRIRRLKERLKGLPFQQNWQQQKDQYQDSLIVLSRIPYSNVTAATVGLSSDEWLDQSLRIRLEHECAHYFTLRHFGCMHSNMYDELIADYLGICAVAPHFRADWFLQFIGLDNAPEIRKDGRLYNYLGPDGLSASALRVLQVILLNAAQQLEAFDQQVPPDEDLKRVRRLMSLCTHNLLELAAPDGHKQLLKTFYKQDIAI